MFFCFTVPLGLDHSKLPKTNLVLEAQTLLKLHSWPCSGELELQLPWDPLASLAAAIQQARERMEKLQSSALAWGRKSFLPSVVQSWERGCKEHETIDMPMSYGKPLKFVWRNLNTDCNFSSIGGKFFSDSAGQRFSSK